MNLESASSRADQIARQYLAFGEVPHVSQLVKRIEAVEAENVRELADDIFSAKQPSLSAVGQLSTLASYSDIAARFATKR
jgi:predicted Zn-dependent peptidase